MNKYYFTTSINFLLFLFFNLAYPVPIIKDFCSQDTPPITKLIELNWSKLFTYASFNPGVVNNILVNKRPGNYADYDKQLIIKVLYDDETNIIIGFITYYYINAHTCNIELLAIDQAYRAQGHGTKLIEHVQAQAQKAGAQFLQLYVYTSNPKAIELYTHLGFQTKQRLPGCLLLSKKI